MSAIGHSGSVRRTTVDPDVLPAPLAARLRRLAPDQLAAATAEPGPVLCVAPAGSGKTTTLVARIAWLVATGRAPPDATTAIAFNRRAAEEMTERVDAALGELGVAAGSVRVRTFHALGRDILADAGRSVEPLVDRDRLLRALWPAADAQRRRSLDDAFARLKLEAQVGVDDIERDPEPGLVGSAFVRYERALQAMGGLDFDDLVARALAALRSDEALRTRWRARCRELLVDEAQDVDRAQLDLALLLAAPAHRIFLVGDDDQSIYGWRLADVRRILSLAEPLPGLRRIDLVTNYRCPAPVIERAVRLVALNEERFVKVIRAGPAARGRLVLAPDAADDDERVRHVVASWPADGTSRAILARTNRELLPAAVVALELGIPFRAARLALLVEDPRLDGVLDAVAAEGNGPPLLVRIERIRARLDAAEAAARPEASSAGVARVPSTLAIVEARAGGDPPISLDASAEHELPASVLAAGLLAWAPRYGDLEALRAAVRDVRERLARLRRDDAALTLATAHSTKGLEFDHVAVIGLDAGRFPSARTLADASDPIRTLEEERRLAYVAWTRARRSLTLVYDPIAPSRFMTEAFDPDELAPINPRARPGARAA